MKAKIGRNILLSLFFLCVAILFCKTAFTLSQTLTPDFSVYYNAAQNTLMGNSVYVGHTMFTLFAYPLVSTLPFLLFTFLSYQTAQIVFLLLNAAALGSVSFLIPILINKKQSLLFSAFIFSFSYLSFPTKFTLGMGQINLIAYVLLLFSFFFFQKKKHFLTALLFTIACISKPILGFTILFFLINKQWRIISYSASLFTFWFWLPLLLDKNAFMDYLYYFLHVIPEVSKPSGKEIYYNQGIMAFAFRLVTNQTIRLLLSYSGMVVIFVTGLFTALKQKNKLCQFSIFLTMLPLLDTMSWQHHFIVLILPFTYAVYTFYKQKKYKLLSLLTVAYLLVSINIKDPALYIHFPLNLLLSNTFYGALLLFIVLISTKKLFQKSQ